jgi:NTE family protein
MDQYKDDPRYRYRLRVITADISLGKLLVLPQDIADYGQAPDSLDIARAVRMSMSIPFFFEPVILQHRGHPSYVVDGGVLSNFPVWLFDDETGEPAWPTFGYKLVDPSDGKPAAITGPVSLLGALFSTMMEAHDARYIQDQHFARTIAIPTLGVRTTDFDIAPARRDALYESGRQAAQEFFETWNFEHYKRTYRSKPPAERRERITAGA